MGQAQACSYTYNSEGYLAEYVDYTTGKHEVYRYGLGGMTPKET